VDQCVVFPASCVRKRFTDDQFQIAYLLQVCVMVRDRSAKLSDCFTVGDMSDIASYLSTCRLTVSLSVSLYLYIHGVLKTPK